MPRLSLAGPLACVVVCLLPAAARAVEYRVASDQALAPVVAAAPAGSTVTVQGGSRREDLVVDKPLTLTGIDGAKVLGTVSATAGELVLNTLAIEGGGLQVGPDASAALTGVSLTRPAGAGGRQPLLDVAGRADLARSSVYDLGSGEGTPGVRVTGAGGLRAVSSTFLSTAGPAVVFTASSGNALRRSTAVTTAPTADAVRLEADSAGRRLLIVDASFVIGGSSAAGVRVVTAGAPPDDASTLILRYATVFGAARGLVLDGGGLGAGSIAGGVQSSIVHAPSAVAGGLLNRVALDWASSDSPGCGQVAGGATCGEPQQFTAEATRLFGRDLHLRADAPVVDAGPATVTDPDVAMDIDGQGRPIGAATDIGADEFLNVAPTAALAPAPKRPEQGQVVTFSSTASDPNVGDRVTAYAWDFGDGRRVLSDVPVVAHRYRRPGVYTASLATVDTRGLPSKVATATVTVRDTRSPVVAVGRATATTGRVVAAGRHRDAAGLATVQVAVTRTSGAGCGQFTGSAVERRSCSSHTWLPAVLDGGRWTYAARGLDLPPGRYVLRARGTDRSGRTSGADGAKVRLRVR